MKRNAEQYLIDFGWDISTISTVVAIISSGMATLCYLLFFNSFAEINQILSLRLALTQSHSQKLRLDSFSWHFFILAQIYEVVWLLRFGRLGYVYIIAVVFVFVEKEVDELYFIDVCFGLRMEDLLWSVGVDVRFLG